LLDEIAFKILQGVGVGTGSFDLELIGNETHELVGCLEIRSERKDDLLRFIRREFIPQPLGNGCFSQTHVSAQINRTIFLRKVIFKLGLGFFVLV